MNFNRVLLFAMFACVYKLEMLVDLARNSHHLNYHITRLKYLSAMWCHRMFQSELQLHVIFFCIFFHISYGYFQYFNKIAMSFQATPYGWIDGLVSWKVEKMRQDIYRQFYSTLKENFHTCICINKINAIVDIFEV
jgi:hypothetical protein